MAPEGASVPQNEASALHQIESLANRDFIIEQNSHVMQLALAPFELVSVGLWYWVICASSSAMACRKAL